MTTALPSPAGGVLGALALALLLGARHALDADHLTAVTQLVLGDRRRGLRRSGLLGLWWGLGHASTLCALGLPVVLYGHHLPGALHRVAELAVGLLIVALGLRLFLRPRTLVPAGAPAEGRTPLTAFGVGLVHGVGGSAGVGVLAVASVTGPAALATLLVFSTATAASMAASALALGYLVTREPLTRRVHRLLPALGLAGTGFGIWYTARIVL